MYIYLLDKLNYTQMWTKILNKIPVKTERMQIIRRHQNIAVIHHLVRGIIINYVCIPRQRKLFIWNELQLVSSLQINIWVWWLGKEDQDQHVEK